MSVNKNRSDGQPLFFFGEARTRGAKFQPAEFFVAFVISLAVEPLDRFAP